MQARMKNPATYLPDAVSALMALGKITHGKGVPDATLELTHLRASQLNGCAACLEGGTKTALRSGVTTEQLATLAGWREAPYFDEGQRAALALAEAMTRLADRSDPVPDEVWDRAAAQFDEPALAALVLWIATTNLYNRINVTTRQVPGQW